MKMKDRWPIRLSGPKVTAHFSDAFVMEISPNALYLSFFLFFFLPEPQGTVLPRLIEPPEERRKIEKIKWVGENVLLPCVAQGLPVPEST